MDGYELRIALKLQALGFSDPGAFVRRYGWRRIEATLRGVLADPSVRNPERAAKLHEWHGEDTAQAAARLLPQLLEHTGRSE